MANVFRPGMIVRDYIIDEIIGSGSFGTVMSAKVRGHDLERALKAQSARTTMGMIQNEFEILRTVQGHEGCQKLYGTFLELEHQIFILELYGPSLRRYTTEHGKLSMENVHRLTSQLLDALQFLKSKSIVHRDLSSSNVCIKKDMTRAVLIDFGLAHNRGFPNVRGLRLMHSHVVHPDVNRGRPYEFHHELFSVLLVLLDVRLQHHLWRGANLEETVNKKRQIVSTRNMRTFLNDDDQDLVELFRAILTQQTEGVDFEQLRMVLLRNYERVDEPFLKKVVDGQTVLETD